MRKISRNRVIAALVASVLVSLPISSIAFASNSLAYTFDNAGDLAANFTGYVASGSAAQSLTGGINDSGAINAPGSADAVFTSKSSYSLGPVGSSYTFASFVQSVGNSGYSGMGFTTFATPNSSNSSSSRDGVFRPNDALGLSVHGGGFVFHNGSSSLSGSWNSDNAGMTTIVKSLNSELLNLGSADDWYKIVLTITRDSATTFDTRVEVWPATSDGTLLRPAGADAIFEIRDQTNATLTTAPSINTYINFSGDRVRYFDGYAVDLAGGATVVEAGAPVVLTTGAVDANNVVTVDGNVTGNGGSAVTERGFVYATTTDPTTSDLKVVLGDGTGTFSGVTPSLPNGTYYFRAFATNATGTSYGVTQQLTLTSALSPQVVTWAPTNTEALTSASPLTPNAGASSSGTGTISYSVQSAGTTNCSVDNVTGVLSFNAAGSCVVRATAAANSTYTSAFEDVTFVIGSTTTTVSLTLDVAVGEPTAQAPVEYATTGLLPGSAWDLIVRSNPQTLASGHANGAGIALGSGSLPAGLSAGWHSVTFSGTGTNGGFVTTTIWFEVAADGTLLKTQSAEPTGTIEPSISRSDTLSSTGGSNWSFLMTAAGLTLLGAVILAGRRRLLRTSANRQQTGVN